MKPHATPGAQAPLPLLAEPVEVQRLYLEEVCDALREAGKPPEDALAALSSASVAGPDGLMKLASGGRLLVPAAVTFAAGEPGSRIRRFKFSDSAPNRRRDRVMTAGGDFSAYLANPILLFCHDAYSLPLGNVREMAIQGDDLVGTIELDAGEFEDRVLAKIDSGSLRAVSIGIFPKKMAYVEERSGYDIMEWELAEVSLCPLPANPRALRTHAEDVDQRLVLDFLALSAGKPVEVIGRDRLALIAKRLGCTPEVVLAGELPAPAAPPAPNPKAADLTVLRARAAQGVVSTAAELETLSVELTAAGGKPPWVASPERWAAYCEGATALWEATGTQPAGAALLPLLAAAGLSEERRALAAVIAAAPPGEPPTAPAFDPAPPPPAATPSRFAVDPAQLRAVIVQTLAPQIHRLEAETGRAILTEH